MYFHYNPDLKGVEFREVSDGLYEQFMLRHPSTDAYHATWYTFPDLSEYSTNDLFSKHPTRPNLWFYEGRSDDVIVFSNGEKFNPSAMEATLRTHPSVSRVIVVGQARFEPAALIELHRTPSEEEKKDLLDSFTPYLIRVNETAPAYAKLQRDHITFTRPDRPMILADKGTIKRTATAKAYDEEIEQLYAQANDSSLPTIKLDAEDLESLEKGLQELLVGTLGLESIASEQDIFAVGADSLQVMNLVRQLRSSFEAQHGHGVVSPHLITPKIVYANPTAAKLANTLHQMSGHTAEASGKLEEQRIKKMEEMLNKYSQDLTKASTEGDHVKQDDEKLTVVLTGSTGSLGSYLLDVLLSSERVKKIICLNRGVHSEDKQKNMNASRGLVTEWGSDKAQFLTTDLSKPRLGLNSHDYDLLVRDTSYIIRKSMIILHNIEPQLILNHSDNQWQVDFNLSLASFEPHIAGVKNFITLSSQSAQKPPILFTSSVSTLMNWHAKHPSEKVPERAFHDFTIPGAMGYAESKYIGELLLEAGAEKCGVPAVVCRVGQLAGPVVKGGVWNKQEWLPSVSLVFFIVNVSTTFPGKAGMKRRCAGKYPSRNKLTSYPTLIDHSQFQISRQNPYRTPNSGHRILGPSRHHRQHHRRPRSRHRKHQFRQQNNPHLIIKRPLKPPPLQHRQPQPQRLAHPRPNRNRLLRLLFLLHQQTRYYRTRPLPRLALRPPRFFRPRHRRRS